MALVEKKGVKVQSFPAPFDNEEMTRLDPGLAAKAGKPWFQGTKCFPIGPARVNGDPPLAGILSDAPNVTGRENPIGVPGGRPSVPSSPCMASSHPLPVCYVWLLFLSRWKRGSNAVMTNGRLWKDLLDNYQCFSSLNFPFVSHYFIWGISTTHIARGVCHFILLYAGLPPWFVAVSTLWIGRISY